MLNRGKEGVTKKVTFKQRPEGGEGISLAGRACREKRGSKGENSGAQLAGAFRAQQASQWAWKSVKSHLLCICRMEITPYFI